ncbi:glycosyltransferase [Bosea sp. NBC_00550]|uniref:glycosyltransferase n=1 Tax=Bosea sp. NBC_00550 TaxID=2969621 RepID=UPI00222EE605|nr:glycosyltransferase [Bosea sp. NBC_00550]UZF91301.1 glycosyltransferase [Bosea sp. NBC_00550]
MVETFRRDVTDRPIDSGRDVLPMTSGGDGKIVHSVDAELEAERRKHGASRRREARLQRRVKELELQLNSATAALSSTHQELERLKASASWRALAPLRNLMGSYPAVARRLRQGAKLTYWTVTGQIVGRLKESIAYRFSPLRPEMRLPASALVGKSPDGLPLFLENYLLHRWPGHDFQAIKLAYRFVTERPNSPIDEAMLQETEIAALLLRLRELAAVDGGVVHPSVSIIIPVHNALAHTLACLLSLLSQQCLHSFEIIIADDVSTDATSAAISSIGGKVRVVRPERNLGFVRNCNAAAKDARGTFLIFLNNDTIALPGWLDALITPLTEVGSVVGLTCSKLLNGDGSLQEAGGVFWQDGTAWNYGRGADPRAYPFNFVRETDYGSGAAIAIPMARWQEVGGFDDLFAPAYCEDADLAFALRARGYRTLYIPTAEIVHHEGVSHGRDDSKGIKAYQVENLKKLRAKWAVELASHFPNGQNVAMAVSRSRFKPKILVIDHYVPQWDRDAGSRAMDGYLRFLVANRFHVTFWPDNKANDFQYGPTYQNLGIEIIYAWPGQIEFEDWIVQRGADFDYVIISRPHVALNVLSHLKKYTPAKLLFIGHDLHGARLRAERRVSNPSAELDREIDKADAMETSVWQAVDAIYYPSKEEADYVSKRGISAPARALPLFLFGEDDIAHRQNASALQNADAPHAMFVGGFRHRPNVDGILWFCREIWPLVKEQLPSARFTIAGSEPPLEITQLMGGSIDVTGYISDADLDALYRSADIVVAPLRFGAGVKGKVIEALRQGLPLALTSVAAEGIEDIAEAGVVVDEPEAFANAVIELLRAGEHRRMRISKGQELIRKHYSVEAVRSVLAEDIPELAAISEDMKLK